ncbi:galactokinase [Cryobacterium sp. BB736]|uniref:galactokinase n=1 Tax=Cryobacterium sp. BB736 TaxID=2746963 RepID=UPI001873AA27|nr:galactokinase [Cryobacterium sp. BB736]
MSDLRDDVRDGFRNAFKSEPAGVWSAPGRVNLIGEHTDYNEGFVLPFAIDRRTVVAVGVRDDRRMRVASTYADEVAALSMVELRPGQLGEWSAYPLGVAWALGEFGVDLGGVPGVDIFIDSDVPVGAGLSSSAAVECAVAIALNDVWQLGLDRQTLAQVCQRAENAAVGAPTGIMDQYAALFGRKDSAVFLDCRGMDAEPIPLGFAEAGLAIAVIDTGVQHSTADGEYAERREACERGARELGVPSLRELRADRLDEARRVLDDVTFRRVRHVVTENQRVLDTVRTLRERGPAAIGPFLDASHLSLRNDFEVSTPELDLAVETANANGALGARMTGAGFGGSVIALVPNDALSLLRVAIDGAFAEHGLGQPDTFVVTASGGAQRDF